MCTLALHYLLFPWLLPRLQRLSGARKMTTLLVVSVIGSAASLAVFEAVTLKDNIQRQVLN